jgi:hypothetical protein
VNNVGDVDVGGSGDDEKGDERESEEKEIENWKSSAERSFSLPVALFCVITCCKGFTFLHFYVETMKSDESIDLFL